MNVKETTETINLLKENGWSETDASQFLSNIETMKADVDLSKLATKEGLDHLQEDLNELKKDVKRLDNRLWAFLLVIVAMIAGLYFKH